MYDALNVLTALDMIKKDRNKIEFIRDVHEVFGNGKKNFHTPEITREERESEVNAQLEAIHHKKKAIQERLKQKKQYLDEITVQVALLKKLVRRNMKNEDNETTINTPVKTKEDPLTLAKFQKSKKINLPMLVLEFKKNSDLEVLMNEDHKEVVILSDSNCRLYNDNHVLLSTGLLNESEQGNIENLYETEIKPLHPNGEEEKEKEMRPPSPTGNVKIKVSNIPKVAEKGGIVNISSPFKESEYKDPNLTSPF